MSENIGQADEFFRAAFEAAPAGMVLIDADGAIVLLNSATETLFGYSREELRGQPVELLVPERFRAHHPYVRAGFFAKPETRRVDARRDLFGARKDGSEFPVEIGLNLVETGEAPCAWATITDLTERTRLEEAVGKDRALLEAIHLAQTQFILEEDPLSIFGEFLKRLVVLTDSEYVKKTATELFRYARETFQVIYRNFGMGRTLFGWLAANYFGFLKLGCKSLKQKIKKG